MFDPCSVWTVSGCAIKKLNFKCIFLRNYVYVTKYIDVSKYSCIIRKDISFYSFVLHSNFGNNIRTNWIFIPGTSWNYSRHTFLLITVACASQKILNYAENTLQTMAQREVALAHIYLTRLRHNYVLIPARWRHF